MCGIAGLVTTGSTDGARAAVTAMCRRIDHRGPDGSGIAADGGVAIGMTRLAIVDIEHGKQPMFSDDGRVALVFNGEIYNAPAIRKRLQADGVRFHTRSDTEVILRLYERAPDTVEGELVGMWAFAIHDRRRAKLVLSRDRFGIKPLFVASAGGALGFASELRCFDRALPELAPCFTLNHAAAHAMLAWSYVPEDACIFTGVKRLAPASRMELDLKSGASRTRKYWTPTASSEGALVRSLTEACEVVEPLLRHAVREHLESDVPIATFLSGGIDSSLVSLYAAEASSRPIKAYTIGFREPRFDESVYARRTAERIGIPIEVTILDEALARHELADAMLAYDEPFGDSSGLATYLLSNRVARDYKVALAGDGGDEVFAGYKKHQILWARRALGAVPGASAAISRALRMVPARTDRSSGWTDMLRVLRKTSRGLAGSNAEAYVALTQFGTLAQTAPLVAHPGGADAFEQTAIGRYEEASGTDLQRTLSCDLGGPLPNDMLTKVDRATMANSLEARVPFLDHRVVELGLGLPARFTLGTRGKRVLRALHERTFGEALARRPKQGFGVPVERWLATSLDLACERIFDRRRLRRFDLLSDAELSDGGYRRWVARDPMLLWNAFALAIWCEASLGDGPSSVRELLETREPGTRHTHVTSEMQPARSAS